MALNVQGRIITPGGLLTGGSRSTGGSVGPGLQKLANLFKRDRTDEGPRVKGGQDLTDRHRVQFAKVSGSIDLARMFKGETARTAKERKEGPLPKDGVTKAMQALGPAAGQHTAQVAKDLTEINRVLDHFNKQPSPGKLDDNAKAQLGKFKDALDAYATVLHDELGGQSDALDTLVNTTVAELADISARISEKLGTDKPKQTSGASSSSAPQQSQPTPPPKTLKEKVDDLAATRDKVRDTMLAPIATLHDAVTEKAGKAGKWAQKQSDLTGAQVKAHAEIDKALVEINKLISESSSDPAKSGEVAALKALRTELTGFAVQVEFPHVMGTMPKSFSSQSVQTALRGIGHVPDHPTFDLAKVGKMMNGHAEYIREVVHGLNAGHDPVTLKDGSTISLRDFRTELDDYSRVLGRLIDEDSPPEFTSAIDTATAKLSELSKQMGIRIGLEDTVAALEKFQTVPGALKDPQKTQQETALKQITAQELSDAGLTAQDIDPKGRAGSAPPPLGTLLRAIRTTMPSIDIDGHTATLSQKRNASEALGTLCQLAVDGEPPDMLLGHSSALNSTLLALKQEKNVGTTPPLTKQELIEAGQRRKAATLRQELALANAQLDRLLKIKGGTRVFGQGAASIRKDTAFIDALHNLGGKKAGREVAFLIARISDLEVKTFTLEQQALGLHPDLDLTSFGPKGSNLPVPQQMQTGVLEHAGITDKDLQRMGLSGKDREEVGELVSDLNRKGMGSVRDVEATSKAIDKGIRGVVRNQLAQDSMLRFSQDTVGGLGRTLMNDILVQAKLMETGRLPPDGMTTVKDPDVEKAFKWQNTEIEKRVKAGNAGDWDKLANGADDYRTAQFDMVKLLGEFDAVEKTSDTHRARLVKLGGPPDKGGLDLDLDTRKPRGLESARSIIEALDAHEALKTDPGNRDLIAKRDGALDRLKGLDTTRMHRPWHQKVSAAFGRAGRPDIATLGQLREAAESIIYLRDTAVQKKNEINDRIAVQTVVLDDILSTRSEAHSLEIGALRQQVRAAILASWPPGARDFSLSNGRTVEGYDPSTKRDEIIAQLKQWGVDTDRFGPEIDKEMYGTLTLNDMRRWSDEATLSTAVRHRETTAAGFFFGTDSPSGRRDVDAPTKRALLSAMETMVDGGKLSLKAGHRVTLDTGKIPLEPTGLNTLKGKLAGANVGHIEIERGSDGYRLHLRSGGEGKLGVEYGLGYKLADYAKAEIAGAGGDLSYAYTSGVTLTFKPNDEGREALLNLMTKMIDNKPIGVSDWSMATDVSNSTEHVGKVSGMGRVGIRAELMYAIDGGTKHDKLGAGVNAELTGTAGVGGKLTYIDSLREHTHKSEIEVSVGVSVSAQLYARISNPLNIAGSQASSASGLTSSADKNYDLSSFQNTEIASGSVGISGAYTRKWKQVTDDQGFYTKGEIVNQTDVRMNAVMDFFTVSDGHIAQRMEANPEFAENLRTLLAMSKMDDVIAITYSLKPEAMLHANTLIDQAKALRAEGRKDHAKELEARAKQIAEDPTNHLASKISVVSTRIDKNEVTNLNARWIRWDVYSDGKLEHPALSLNVT